MLRTHESQAVFNILMEQRMRQSPGEMGRLADGGKVPGQSSGLSEPLGSGSDEGTMQQDTFTYVHAISADHCESWGPQVRTPVMPSLTVQ